MGLPVGPRAKVLKAARGLEADKTNAAVAPEAAKPISSEAERRQLTVMFCDLVGSTALSERLDPEELRGVMQAYRKACADVIGRYDGHVAQYLGDGVMVYFGWPAAHEDDAGRAVRAGLDVVDAVAALQTEAKLSVRIGIATGLVVVGESGADEGADAKLAVGETPNIAARIQAIAEPGSVAIAQSTRRLLGGAFALDNIGTHDAKGVSGGLQVHRVLGAAETESRFEASHGTALTPLVGRENEIAMLIERWDQAKDGEGQVVVLSGEAGIGKSRVTQVLRERLADDTHTRLRYQCSPYYMNSAFYPVIAQLERAAGFARDDDADAKLDKMEALLGQSATHTALFAALLSLPIERYPALVLSPQKQKENTIAALADQVAGLAASQPVLMIFEDAHWIDPTTLETIGAVIAAIRDHPVLLVITSRPEFESPWTGHGHVTSLTLGRLGRKLGAAMVAKVIGGKALPEEVLDHIVAKTDGVPLFVEELTKTVIESEIVREGDDAYELTGPLTELAIPSTIQDSLMARLDRVAETKNVAQIGSCIGRSVDSDLLSSAAGLSADALQSALGRLVNSEILVQLGTPPNATYMFKHAMIHEAANVSLLRSRRRAIHRKIVQALKKDFSERIEREPEYLARHLTEAELFEEAAEAWLRAGNRAAERSATAEALGHFRQGLGLVEKLADGPERHRRELDLQLSLGGALITARGYGDEEARMAHERARELSMRGGTVKQTLAALFRTFTFEIGRSEMRRSLELAQELVSLASDSGSPSMERWSMTGMALTEFHMGNFRAGLEWARRSLASQDMSKNESRFKGASHQDPITMALMYEGFALLLMGYPDQGRAIHAKAVRHARENSNSYSRGFAVSTCGAFAFTGDTDKVKSMTDEAIEIGRTQGYPYIEAFGLGYKGIASAQGKSFGDAARLIDDALTILADSTTSIGNSLFRPVLALSMGKMGRVSEGLAEIENLLSWTGETEERWQEAEAYRVKGELLILTGLDQARDAERSFQSAIDVAARQEARWWELRAATSLARLWQNQGKRQEAHDLLAPVYDWFTEGFDTSDLKETKALLVELGA
ncbi:MAG: adenylate/guanylate cyclase domain-containing protein [Alphaproteobacteria bacterium]|nr:adenylate/guanylate cyclase domain-containing protein [Alphaproteobacteria bacterium]